MEHQDRLHNLYHPQTFRTSPLPSQTPNLNVLKDAPSDIILANPDHAPYRVSRHVSNTSKGVLIGMLSALSSALLIVLILGLVYFLRYTSKGRILLDRIGRPGEFDDEQAFAKEEAEALEEMDDIQRAEYMRAKAFVESNPPESAQTDISLSQFLAIQEKGVSAWEFEPALEITNCFVEARTEVEFFDSECSVQTNLPVPKQNEVYYWEAKIYEKADTSVIGIGMTTKPYPLFRMPGYHKTSVAYLSPGDRRFNQPFRPTPSYGPTYFRGDVIGVGYRPRTGTVFFTRNGKKLDDITHTLKSQNLFPTIGAIGPATVHVNFGQMGFVYIEANVKKWGLAPMTGSLAPPPPYGSEQGSILLDQGQHGVSEGQGGVWSPGSGWGGPAGGRHTRSRSAQVRLARGQLQRSPGPQRSPTDISLAQLEYGESEDGYDEADDDVVEGRGGEQGDGYRPRADSLAVRGGNMANISTQGEGLGLLDVQQSPPEYSSPIEQAYFSNPRHAGKHGERRRREDYFDASSEEDEQSQDGREEVDPDSSTPRPTTAIHQQNRTEDPDRSPPVPYEVAVGSAAAENARRST